MKHKISCMALLCIFFGANAQKRTSDHYLKIGDQLPDLQISNILNSDCTSAKTADFKGKVLLLDFWCTSCAGCIASFPEMDSLQRVYKDKLRILTVNMKTCHDTDAGIKRVLKVTNAWSKRRFNLPIAASDTTLTGYFDFWGVPFYAWISPEGKVMGFSNKSAVNHENILRVFSGESLLTSPESKKGAKP